MLSHSSFPSHDPSIFPFFITYFICWQSCLLPVFYFNFYYFFCKSLVCLKFCFRGFNNRVLQLHTFIGCNNACRLLYCIQLNICLTYFNPITLWSLHKYVIIKFMFGLILKLIIQTQP